MWVLMALALAAQTGGDALIRVEIEAKAERSAQQTGEHLVQAGFELNRLSYDDNRILISVTPAELRRLRADPTLQLVRPLALIPSNPPSLRRARLSIAAGKAELEWSANPSAAGPGVLGEPGRTLWPGEMVRVELRDAQGELLAERYAADPRFTRFEGWDEKGAHIEGSNQSFVDETAPLTLDLSLPAAPGLAQILVFDRTGSALAPAAGRLLARIDIAEEEAPR